MKLREMGSGGSFKAIKDSLLDEVVYEWDAAQHLPLPTKVSFRYIVPTHYTNVHNGERLRLPPTYEAHLQGVPGFRVEVRYGVTVYLKHTRDISEWWRTGSRWVHPRCQDMRAFQLTPRPV